jgi:pSer/pThr/pTyr-binding forkhead associated (FHA) protein
MEQDLEHVLRSADTVGKPARPSGLQKRLTIVAALLRDAPAGHGPRLIWRDVQGMVQVIATDRDLLIGRAPTCDIVLSAPKVSRRHCRVLCRTGHSLVQDLDSTHGTFVNGEREQQCSLADGDLLAIGGELLAYSLG